MNEWHKHFEALAENHKKEIPLTFKLMTAGSDNGKYYPRILRGDYYQSKSMMAFSYHKSISKLPLINKID
jgi:hypothetical protein